MHVVNVSVTLHCVQLHLYEYNYMFHDSHNLTLWRRNYFFNFSTPCI